MRFPPDELKLDSRTDRGRETSKGWNIEGRERERMMWKEDGRWRTEKNRW